MGCRNLLGGEDFPLGCSANKPTGVLCFDILHFVLLPVFLFFPDSCMAEPGSRICNTWCVLCKPALSNPVFELAVVSILHCDKRSRDILGRDKSSTCYCKCSKRQSNNQAFCSSSSLTPSSSSSSSSPESAAFPCSVAADLEQPKRGPSGGEAHPPPLASYGVLLEELLPASRNWAASSFSASEGFTLSHFFLFFSKTEILCQCRVEGRSGVNC